MLAASAAAAEVRSCSPAHLRYNAQAVVADIRQTGDALETIRKLKCRAVRRRSCQVDKGHGSQELLRECEGCHRGELACTRNSAVDRRRVDGRLNGELDGGFE